MITLLGGIISMLGLGFSSLRFILNLPLFPLFLRLCFFADVFNGTGFSLKLSWPFAFAFQFRHFLFKRCKLSMITRVTQIPLYVL